MNSYVHKFIQGNKAETALVLHGTGADEQDLIPLVSQLLPGVSILSLRGDESEHGMLRFFRRFEDGSFDVANILQKITKLEDFVTFAVQEYKIDASKLIGFGLSNGANMLASLLLRKPQLLSAAVLLRPTLPVEPIANLKSHAQILIAAGLVDPYAPAAKVAHLVQILRTAGASITEHKHPGGHELGSDDLVAVAKWYQSL